MINPSPYYPYQQNVQILKGFFSKPLTLICGIVAGISALFGTVHINSGSGGTSISMSASVGPGGSVSILLCLALIFLYIKSRSNDPMPFGSMVTLIKIYAVIGIIAAGMATLVMAGLTVAVNLFLNDAFRYFIMFIIIVAPFVLITLLHSVAMLLWSNSIKKGATSVYLSSRGSVLLGVTSILLAVAGIVTTIAVTLYIKSYGNEISEFLRQLADKYPNFHYNNILESNSDLQSIFLSAATVITIISSALSVVFYGLLAALAFSFHIYIKKRTNGINLGVGQAAEYNAPQNSVPVAPVAPVTDETPMQNVVQQPVDFQPQSVDFGSMDESSEDAPKTAQFENPYMQAVADDMSDKADSVVCPNCHMQCNSDMKFCGNCGTKLK